MVPSSSCFFRGQCLFGLSVTPWGWGTRNPTHSCDSGHADTRLSIRALSGFGLSAWVVESIDFSLDEDMLLCCRLLRFWCRECCDWQHHVMVTMPTDIYCINIDNNNNTECGIQLLWKLVMSTITFALKILSPWATCWTSSNCIPIREYPVPNPFPTIS